MSSDIYRCRSGPIALWFLGDHTHAESLPVGRLLHAGLLQKPCLNLGVPLAQQIERADPVMLLGGRRWLVAHDLRRDSRGAFHPFR